MSHIRTIIKLEDPDLRVSKDALMAVNTAAVGFYSFSSFSMSLSFVASLLISLQETFVEQFVQEAYTCCAEDRKKCLSYDHLDFVPERVKAEDALRERSAAGKGG
ncbi:hypothetical protein JHK84_033354 [Glycine max]|nr:hypothetical protein JHK85_033724 [Glycine max]KAG4985417.1 hypothetical protein JHK86_033108 [Glycine max]KAG5139586.1 hypothetical protein JHK84_033354 [Glycine max]